MKFDIQMYSDFQCPFCYIGKSILDTVTPDYDTEFTFKAFEIHSDAPEEGISAKDYFGLSNIENMGKQIKDYGKKFGVDIADLETVVNSNKALRLAEYAKEVGKGDQYNDVMYKAMFVDKINIGLDKDLKMLASIIGINSDEVDKVLAEPRYKNTLLDNQYYCTKNQITSVPTFIINNKVRITGAQPPEVFREVFEKFEKGEL
ncbi:MAG: DsbA family oxidoreductase [Spirochaetaceae bacterium]|nr:DsbA family oxidoreductase [Spirochaetaceae bacterium]